MLKNYFKNTKNTIKLIKPLSTSICQKKDLTNGRVIVLENYYKYAGESNLYCIDQKSQQVIWFAELPVPDDIYSNKFSINNSEITISSFNGITVKIDCNTGKITDKTLSK